jgi:hypothetical protein
MTMQKRTIAIATSMLLVCSATVAGAQGTTTQPSVQPQAPANEQGPGNMGPGTMRQGGMMGGGMMGMMRGGMMGRRAAPGVIMRIIFALMDTDSDGTVSLQEFQAAHERIFKAMDANKDGKLTLEEMQSFIRGQPRQSPPQ